MMAEKGYEFAEVKSTVEALPGGPKLVKVVFDVNEGPKVKVRDIDFIGNDEVSDGTLKRQMKATKEHWFLSWITGRGTYQEAKFEEDAEKVDRVLPRTRATSRRASASPEIKTLEDSDDKETRWVQLRIPVTEGPRYRVGEVKFDGNKVIKTEFLQPLFKLKTGRLVLLGEGRPQGLREGARDLRRRRLLRVHRVSRIWSSVDAGRRARSPGPREPTVNVTMRMTEGEQYFVNRITFTGNTTTRDNVIRREMRLRRGRRRSTPKR